MTVGGLGELFGFGLVFLGIGWLIWKYLFKSKSATETKV